MFDKRECQTWAVKGLLSGKSECRIKSHIHCSIVWLVQQHLTDGTDRIHEGTEDQPGTQSSHVIPPFR